MKRADVTFIMLSTSKIMWFRQAKKNIFLKSVEEKLLVSTKETEA